MTDQTELWAIVEMMGHQKIAGRYLKEEGLHRVDIPDTSLDAVPDSFTGTQLIGVAAIFRITFVSKEAAFIAAQSYSGVPPVFTWDMRQQMKRLVAPQEPVEALEFEVDEESFFDD